MAGERYIHFKDKFTSTSSLLPPHPYEYLHAITTPPL